MNLSPLPIQKFFDNDGQPLVKGLLFTYAAGTSTKIATYVDVNGVTQNTNPIVLDYRGECRLWIDPQLAYKFVLSPANDTDPPTNPIWTVDRVTVAPPSTDNAALDTGTANNVTLTIGSITSVDTFLRIVFKANATNTGPTLLTLNGFPAKAITWQTGEALAAHEIQAGGIYEVIYSGVSWQMQGPTLSAYKKTASETSAALSVGDASYPELARLRYLSDADFRTAATYVINNAILSSINAVRGGGYGVFGNGLFNQNNAAGDPPHLVEINNDNTTVQCLRLNSYGVGAFGNNIHFCRYNGTQVAPTAISNLQYMVSMGFRGWDGSGALSQSAAAFQVQATPSGGGNWTPSDNGCRFVFQVTRPGVSALSRQNAMFLTHSGVALGTNTTSGWDTTYRVVEVSPGSALRGNDVASEIALVSNGVYTSTGWKYGIDGASGVYIIDQNNHIWSVAPAGVSNAAQTLTETMRIRPDGFWSVGGAGAASARAYHNILSTAAEGNTLLLVRSENTAQTSIQVNTVNSDGHNTAQAAIFIGKNSSTNRSINTGGTINASGADYAEYERKRTDCGEIAKGDVVGFDTDGLLTDRWDLAVTFGIKSTAPAYVGGDTWGADLEGDALEGERLKYDRIAYAGKVPCNIKGAKPGAFVIAVKSKGGGIGGRAIQAMTAKQWPFLLGRVRRTLPDGRAEVAL